VVSPHLLHRLVGNEAVHEDQRASVGEGLHQLDRSADVGARVGQHSHLIGSRLAGDREGDPPGDEAAVGVAHPLGLRSGARRRVDPPDLFTVGWGRHQVRGGGFGELVGDEDLDPMRGIGDHTSSHGAVVEISPLAGHHEPGRLSLAQQ
jgi:hypothetical protein